MVKKLLAARLVGKLRGHQSARQVATVLRVWPNPCSTAKDVPASAGFIACHRAASTPPECLRAPRSRRQPRAKLLPACQSFLAASSQ